MAAFDLNPCSNFIFSKVFPPLLTFWRSGSASPQTFRLLWWRNDVLLLLRCCCGLGLVGRGSWCLHGLRSRSTLGFQALARPCVENPNSSPAADDEWTGGMNRPSVVSARWGVRAATSSNYTCLCLCRMNIIKKNEISSLKEQSAFWGFPSRVLLLQRMRDTRSSADSLTPAVNSYCSSWSFPAFTKSQQAKTNTLSLFRVQTVNPAGSSDQKCQFSTYVWWELQQRRYIHQLQEV